MPFSLCTCNYTFLHMNNYMYIIYPTTCSYIHVHVYTLCVSYFRKCIFCFGCSTQLISRRSMRRSISFMSKRFLGMLGGQLNSTQSDEPRYYLLYTVDYQHKLIHILASAVSPPSRSNGPIFLLYLVLLHIHCTCSTLIYIHTDGLPKMHSIHLVDTCLLSTVDHSTVPMYVSIYSSVSSSSSAIHQTPRSSR